jgi:hypothetical protein
MKACASFVSDPTPIHVDPALKRTGKRRENTTVLSAEGGWMMGKFSLTCKGSQVQVLVRPPKKFPAHTITFPFIEN